MEAADVLLPRGRERLPRRPRDGPGLDLPSAWAKREGGPAARRFFQNGMTTEPVVLLKAKDRKGGSRWPT